MALVTFVPAQNGSMGDVPNLEICDSSVDNDFVWKNLLDWESILASLRFLEKKHFGKDR